MKKLLFALTLVLCLAISMVAFTSCGGNGEGEGEGEGCEHTWSASTVTETMPTCTEDGVAIIKCVVCGEKKADSETAIPATGHAYDAGVTVAATCTTDGTLTQTCATCEYVNVTPITAEGHVWADAATTDVAATCTTDGSESIKCTVCTEVKPESEAVIPAAHTWANAATTDTAPTCTADGSKSVKCTACNAVKEGSVEPIPAVNHSWAAEATVDTAPNCAENGQKSIKCTVCNTVKPGTVESIPSTGEHAMENVTVITTPTLFSEGYGSGFCSGCNQTVSGALPKAEPTVEHLVNEDTAVNQKYNIINDVLNGEHFYPTEENPNGQSLYVELSILWNETLANVNYGYMEFGNSASSDGSANRMTPYYLNFRSGINGQWCKYAGGFEPSSPASGGIYYGPTMPNGGATSDYPYIGSYGWHRVGVEIYQKAIIDGTNVSYKITTSLYIDGEKVSSYDYNLGKNKVNLLFTAEVVDGEVVYTDISDSVYTFAYRIANGKAANADAYFVVGDVSVTCGTDGFVMNVKPVEDPADATFSPADGVELPAKVYFEMAADNTGSEDAGNTGNGGASEDAEENAGGNGGASEDASDSEDAA